MKKNITHSNKLNICKEYLKNSIENFLSSVVNTIFADSLSAEFVVKVNNFELSQHGIGNAASHSTLLMYPIVPEKYSLPLHYIKYGGGICMESVRRASVLKLMKNNNRFDDVDLTGFDINIVLLMFAVLEEDGAEVINEKICYIQECLYPKTEQKILPGYIDANYSNDGLLLKYMLKIIEFIDPELFFSKHFKSVKSWILNEE